MNTYDFPVELAPIKTNGILIPNKMSVIRTDTKQPIGVVSNKYALVRHEEVVKGFRKALGKLDYEEKISTIKNGSRLFVTYKIPSIKVEVQKGDFVALQFVAKNSYDGSRSFSMVLGAFRLVCSNGMVIGKELFSFSQKHVSKGVVFDENLLSERIEQIMGSFKNALPLMQKMVETPMSKDASKIFDAETLEFPKYLVEEAKQEYGRAQMYNRWGFYNALTFAATHRIKKDNLQSRMFFTQKAWSLATSSK